VSNFPEWSATHIQTVKKTGDVREVMRVYSHTVEGEKVYTIEPPPNGAWPQYLTIEGKFTNPSAGALVPKPGVVQTEYVRPVVEVDTTGMTARERKLARRAAYAKSTVVPVVVSPLADATDTGAGESDLTAGDKASVSFHADCVKAIMQAAAFPDWQNSHGSAESVNGDSATVVSVNREQRTKTIRVCSIDKTTRAPSFHMIVVPECMTFELLGDPAENRASV